MFNLKIETQVSKRRAAASSVEVDLIQEADATGAAPSPADDPTVLTSTLTAPIQ